MSQLEFQLINSDLLKLVVSAIEHFISYLGGILSHKITVYFALIILQCSYIVIFVQKLIL